MDRTDRVMTTTRTIGLAAVAWIVAGAAMGFEIYVSPAGNDEDPGSRTRPLRTLEAARDALRQSREAIDGPATVWLLDGVYERDVPFDLDGRDGGREGAPVAYRAVDGARVVISGGRRIPDAAWRPLDDGIRARLPDHARDHVRQVDLATLGIEEYGAISARGMGLPSRTMPMEAFVDGRPLRLARWPNDRWLKVASLPRAGRNTEGGKTRGHDVDRFNGHEERFRRWHSHEDIWVHGYWIYEWSDTSMRVRQILPETKTVVLDEPRARFGLEVGRPYRFFNVLEELDEPGEYYIDREGGRLYLWPPESESESSSSLCVSICEDALVRVEQASWIVFEGLALEAGRRDGITIRDSRHIVFRDGVVRNVGRDAVCIEGGELNAVEGSDIHACGENAVVASGGDRRTLVAGGHRVTDNEIHGIGRWRRTYSMGVKLFGVGNEALHNHIYDCPHTAVFFKGNDHLIAFNHIHHVANAAGDVGVIYTGRDWSMRGTVISNNYIHDTPSHRGPGTMAVYLDDLASGTTVTGNIIVRSGIGVQIGGGRDNLVAGNIFIDNDTAVRADNRGQKWAGRLIRKAEGSWDMLGQLKKVPFDRPPYTERYPELVDFLEKHPCRPSGNHIRGNIVAGCDTFVTPAAMKRGWVVAADNFIDPVDVFAGDHPEEAGFRLDPGGAPAQAGFEEVPFDRIGPRADDANRE